MRRSAAPAVAGGVTLLLLGVAACGGGDVGVPTAPAASVRATCDRALERRLAPGEGALLDVGATRGCARLTAASAGEEYLVAVYSGRTDSAVASPFLLTADGSLGEAPVASMTVSPKIAEKMSGAAGAGERLHAALREAGRRAASIGSGAAASRPLLQTVPVQAPDGVRRFRVCADLACSATASVRASLRWAGRRVQVYQDDSLPSGAGFSDAMLAASGRLFDDQLYGIDTLAFGRESDVDGNGAVIVLATHAVNRLSADCTTAGDVTLGYTYGVDLLPAQPGSNGAEIFYAAVPDTLNPRCRVNADYVLQRLPATFIHEFQHLINYNQHVILRRGPAEEVWLDEGLSHYAEELGGRLAAPLADSVPGARLRQFLAQNVANARRYLAAADRTTLLTAQDGLVQRGAAWLFLRWLVDAVDEGGVTGMRLSRALVATSRTGAHNVAEATGAAFDRTMGEWQIAIGAPAGDGLAARIRYRSFDLRALFEQNPLQLAGLPVPYPRVPTPLTARSPATAGMLRPGSGGLVSLRADRAGPLSILVSEATPERFTLPAGARPLLLVVRLR